jgi:hypothetical protein
LSLDCEGGIGMTAAIWEQVRPRYGYQLVLYLLGIAMLASAAFHLAVFAVDGSGWWGPVSWRKPINFGFSLGMTALSIGWAQGLMPRNRVLGWTVTALVGGASVVELGLITMQTWRGVPSHFNVATTFDAAVFTAMGISVGILTLGLLVVGVWAGFRLRGKSALIAFATGIGLLLFASALGADLISRGVAVVEATGAVPTGVLIGAAGSGKLAHAAGIHGLQVLIALELVLGARGVLGSGRIRMMTQAAIGYVIGTLAITAHAYSGRSMLEPTPLLLAALAISVAAVVAAFAGAVRVPQPVSA